MTKEQVMKAGAFLGLMSYAHGAAYAFAPVTEHAQWWLGMQALTSGLLSLGAWLLALLHVDYKPQELHPSWCRCGRCEERKQAEKQARREQEIEWSREQYERRKRSGGASV